MRLSRIVSGMGLDTDKIRNLRERLGLTQEQAAEKAGLSSRQSWDNIEAGRQPKLQLDILERVADALGLNLHDVLKGVPAKKGGRRK